MGETVGERRALKQEYRTGERTHAPSHGPPSTLPQPPTPARGGECHRAKGGPHRRARDTLNPQARKSVGTDPCPAGYPVPSPHPHPTSLFPESSLDQLHAHPSEGREEGMAYSDDSLTAYLRRRSRAIPVRGRGSWAGVAVAEAKVRGQGSAIRRSDQRLPEPMSGKVLVKTVGRTCLGAACVLGGGQTGKGLVTGGTARSRERKGRRTPQRLSETGVRAARRAGGSIYQRVFITANHSRNPLVKACFPSHGSTVARKGNQPRRPPVSERRNGQDAAQPRNGRPLGVKRMRS